VIDDNYCGCVICLTIAVQAREQYCNETDCNNNIKSDDRLIDVCVLAKVLKIVSGEIFLIDT
jgi:hypothetical protein